MSVFKFLLILVPAFLMLGSGSPIYDYMLITLPVNTVVNYHWLDIWPDYKAAPEPEPPRRNVPEQYQDLFKTTSQSAGIPYGVLESIAFVESRFRASARSPVRDDGHRDLGMFQFNDRYLQWYSDQYNNGLPFDPFVPEEAIRIAVLHILFLFDRYGNWADVFMAYNAGMDRVDRDDIPESAWDYLQKIYREDA
jgi:soluble lytic murein transglycosylase-like protein